VLKSVLILPLAVSKDVNLVEAEDVKLFNEPVDVSIEDNLIFVLDVYEFKELVLVSMEVNLLFCVVLVVLFEPVYVLKSVRIDSLALSKDVNLVNALPLNVFKLPVLVSILVNLLF
jgi:hypothetical protein